MEANIGLRQSLRKVSSCVSVKAHDSAALHKSRGNTRDYQNLLGTLSPSLLELPVGTLSPSLLEL